MTIEEAVIASIMARSTAASGTAVFVDAVVLRQLLAPLLADLAAEVRRTQAMRCETCKHRDYDECAKSAQKHYYDLSSEERMLLCETFGGGCLAWEKRDE